MLAVGQRVARYELVELIAQSDIGAIYKARDVALGRTVALRLVPPDAARDGIVRARLNRETTALAAIDHPNVPPIYETGEHDHQIFIASRWVDGVDLGALVRTDGPLEPRRAVRIVNQVASALQATHALGIMHRDVKPSSVLVTESDHVYLTDFAVARRLDDMSGLTSQQHLARNIDCLAPEYLAGGEADVRVDIYGLGCVLFQALTGETPFGGPGPAAKMYAHAAAEPPHRTLDGPRCPSASTRRSDERWPRIPASASNRRRSSRSRRRMAPTCRARSGRPGSRPRPAATGAGLSRPGRTERHRDRSTASHPLAERRHATSGRTRTAAATPPR